MKVRPPPSDEDLALLEQEELSSPVMRAPGNVVLTLDPYPASIAGHVAGAIAVPMGLITADHVELELLCHHSQRNTDDYNSTSLVWQDIGVFAAKRCGDGSSEVLFCFELPAEVQYSRNGSQERVHWNLRIRSLDDSAQFARHWEIPVLGSGARASAPIAASQARVSVIETDAQLHLQQRASGVVMRHPAGRGAATAKSLLVFGIIFLGAAWLIQLKTSDSILLASVFGMFGVGAFAGGLWLIGNALRVKVDNGSVFVERRLCGIVVAKTCVPSSSVAGLAVTSAGLSLHGVQSKVYYNVVVRKLDGDDVTIADGFVGYSAATSGARRLAELTSLALVTYAGDDVQPLAAQVVRAPAPTSQIPRPQLSSIVQTTSQAVLWVDDHRERVASYAYVPQALFGALFLLCAVLTENGHSLLVLGGARTTGTIVGYQEDPQDVSGMKLSFDSVKQWPRVEFVVAGRPVQFTDWVAGRTTAFDAHNVPIIYDPERPASAMVDRAMLNWMPWAPLLRKPSASGVLALTPTA